MGASTNPETLTTLNQTTRPVGDDSRAGVVGYQITGTCDHVYTPEGTINGTDWVGLLWVPSNSVTAATTVAVSGSPASVMGRVDGHGYKRVRLKLTTATSGSAIIVDDQSVG
jgi:hypothetical protein